MIGLTSYFNTFQICQRLFLRRCKETRNYVHNLWIDKKPSLKDCVRILFEKKNESEASSKKNVAKNDELLLYENSDEKLDFKFLSTVNNNHLNKISSTEKKNEPESKKKVASAIQSLLSENSIDKFNLEKSVSINNSSTYETKIESTNNVDTTLKNSNEKLECEDNNFVNNLPNPLPPDKDGVLVFKNSSPKTKTFDEKSSDATAESTVYLESKNFKIRNVLGDGNCLFRCFSVVLENHENNHANIRKKIVEYVHDHFEDELKNNLQESREDTEEDHYKDKGDYLARMGALRTSGTEYEAAVFSKLFRVNVSLYNKIFDNDSLQTKYVYAGTFRDNSFQTSCNIMHVGSRLGGHWVILYEVSKDSSPSSDLITILAPANNSVNNFHSSVNHSPKFSNDQEINISESYDSLEGVDFLRSDNEFENQLRPSLCLHKNSSFKKSQNFDFELSSEAIENSNDFLFSNVNFSDDELTLNENDLMDLNFGDATEAPINNISNLNSLESNKIQNYTTRNIDAFRKSLENKKNNEQSNLIENFLVLPKDFWEKFVPPKESKKKTLLNGWTDEFNKIFEKKFPFCVLRFLDSKFYAGEKIKNQNYFWAFAQCKHSICTTFFFNCQQRIQEPHEDRIVKVSLEKKIEHIEGEAHRRFLRGSNRDEYKEKLKKNSALYVQNVGVTKIPKEVLKNGNLNHAPTTDLLNQIKSESRREFDLDKDFFLFMEKLRQEYIDEYGTKIVRGYIQTSSYHPLMFVLFTEPQLEYLASQKDIFLNLDATGSIAATPSYFEERVTLYYYVLWLPGGKKNTSPLEIAEAHMSTHNETAVTYFLSLFNDKFKLITTKIIKKIETDFSLVLLKSICKVFNNLCLYIYLKKIFDGEIPKDITVLHCCSSHLIKGSRGKIRSFFPDKKKHLNHRKIATKIMTSFIHCDSLESAKVIFEYFIKIFYFQTEEASLSSSIDSVNNCPEHGAVENDYDDDEKNDENKDNEDLPQLCGKMKGSPYYQFFQNLKNDIVKKASFTDKINEFYSEKFCNYLLNYLLVYLPLWSAIVIKMYGLSRDSNATAENGFKIVKHQYLNELKVSIPRFIQTSETMLRSKLIIRRIKLITERQKSNIATTDILPVDIIKKKSSNNSLKRKVCEVSKSGFKHEVEVWKDKKKIKRGPNKHFTSSKFIAPESLEENPDRLHLELKTIYQDVKKETANLNSNKNSTQSKNKLKKKLLDNSDPDPSVKINLKDSNILFDSKIKYPPNFPNLSKTLNSIPLDRFDFFTLEQWGQSKDITRHYVNDEIVNAFFSLLPSVATKHKIKLIHFDSFYSQNVELNNYIKRSTVRWAKKNEIMSKNIWLIPYNLENMAHWFLIVVFLDRKIILILDSLYVKLRSTVVYGIFTLISALNPNENFKDWKIHAPADVPKQINEFGEVGANCGVHMCSWALTVASVSSYHFEEKDMQQARKSIAHLLYYSVDNNFQKNKKNGKSKGLAECVSLSLKNFEYCVDHNPPLNFTSSFDFCSSIVFLIQEKEKITRSSAWK